MHEAMLKSKKYDTVKSDWMSAATVEAAKNEARTNYIQKYNSQSAWKQYYPTQEELLEDSTYLTK
ncbi:hypothetical protein QT970_03775 [Microcoleus sp. herbarium8]|uniref:hypothetical protein n=1 Tax=unclassified Microcoleus TaxID=2642155 RepID=UPI002FD4BA16